METTLRPQPRLDDAQFGRLEAELNRGPAAHRYAIDQQISKKMYFDVTAGRKCQPLDVKASASCWYNESDGRLAMIIRAGNVVVVWVMVFGKDSCSGGGPVPRIWTDRISVASELGWGEEVEFAVADAG
ncbi:hypothetical protein [Actinomadura vinacea]|uniref:hypothetical protein n=1 Tax=Actinomadura vinacea TaxID=115336 RepID=UPI0031DC2579